MAAEFRSVQTRMWREDDWFQSLDTDARLLFIYLFTNPSASICGLYRLPIRTMAFESGLSVERVKELLDQFSAANKAHYADGVIWVVRMRENQLPGKISKFVEVRLDKDLAAIPDCELKRKYLIAYGYSVDTLSIPRATEQHNTVTDTVTTQNNANADSGGGREVEQAKAVYACWEDNMPGTLSPMIADELAEDIATYGAEEVIHAIGVAVSAGKRSMRYVQGVLRNRATGNEPHKNGKAPQTVPVLPADVVRLMAQ